jgi:isopentenyl-diphosphate delta-isomerase
VLVGVLDEARPEPDPAEVADYRWVHPEELRARLREDPEGFSPWLAGVLEIAAGPPVHA